MTESEACCTRLSRLLILSATNFKRFFCQIRMYFFIGPLRAVVRDYYCSLSSNKSQDNAPLDIRFSTVLIMGLC